MKSELKSIDPLILTVRGQKIILDADRAEACGVETKRLNEQVKRNLDRFPEDFMFRLTGDEKKEVVANCDHLQKLKFCIGWRKLIKRCWSTIRRFR